VNEGRAVVSLVPCETYEAPKVECAVRRALDLLDGAVPLIQPGATVLAKPNLLQARPPEAAITTHPTVVDAVVGWAAGLGGRVVIADQPTYSLGRSASRLMEKTGMAALADRRGVATELLAEAGYVECRVPGAHQLPMVHLAQRVVESDIVVNLPKCKTHMQTFFTGAVKNMFGGLAPRDRMDLHCLGGFRAVSDAIADLYAARPPDLNVMDAVVVMEGSGPARGEPRPLGLIAASRDGVALDRVMTEVLGFRPGMVRTTEAAAELGAGVSDLQQIEVRGVDLDAVRTSIRIPPSHWTGIPHFLARAARRWLYIRPRVEPALCRACGGCAQVCPTGAIQVGQVATIDRHKCIECFCCQEACSFDAIEVERSWLSQYVS